MGVALEGLQRGHDNTMLRFWSNYWCFVDNTHEGRCVQPRTSRAWTAWQEEAIGDVERLACVGRHATEEVTRGRAG